MSRTQRYSASILTALGAALIAMGIVVACGDVAADELLLDGCPPDCGYCACPVDLCNTAKYDPDCAGECQFNEYNCVECDCYSPGFEEKCYCGPILP